LFVSLHTVSGTKMLFQGCSFGEITPTGETTDIGNLIGIGHSSILKILEKRVNGKKRRFW
jgi:hypothetical protein